MRTVIKTVCAVAVAAFVATVLIPIGITDPAYARGGGGGGKGGRGGGGGGRGGGRGGGGGGNKGGNNKKGSKSGMNTSGNPIDYLEQVQREDAEAARPDFIFNERYEASRGDAAYDRAAGLAAAREKASRERRDASESGTHPL